MSLRTLTSGLIEQERGMRPAFQATMRTKSRDAVIRLMADGISGWIGVLYGRYVTGARAQTGGTICQGVEALKILSSVKSGRFDVIEIDSPAVTEELKQSLGVDLARLLELARAKPECQFGDLLEEAEAPLSALTEGVANSELLDQELSGGGSVLVRAAPEPQEGAAAMSPGPVSPEQSSASASSAQVEIRKSEVAAIKEQLTKESLAIEESKGDEPTLGDGQLARARDWLNGEQPVDEDGADQNNVPVAEPLSEPGTTGVLVRDEHEVGGEVGLTTPSEGIPESVWKAGSASSSAEDEAVGQSFYAALAPEEESQVLRDLELTLERAKEGLWRPAAVLPKKEKVFIAGPEDDEARELYHDQMKRKTGSIPKEFLAQALHDDSEDPRARARLVKAVVCVIAVILLMPLMIFGFNQMSDKTAYRLAQDKYSKGDVEGSRRIYGKLIGATNSALAYLGRAETWPEGSEEQLADYDKAVQLNPRDKSVTLKAAWLFYRAKHFDRAYALAALALAQDQSSGEASRICGQSLARLGRPDEAEKYLKQALTQGVANPNIVAYELAEIMESRGRRKDALKYLDKAVLDSPRNYDYLYARAENRFAEKNFDGAVADLDAAVAAGPVPADAYYLRGLSWQEKGDNARAIKDFQQAIDNGCERAEAHRNLGIAYFNQKKYADSVASLDKLLALNPADSLCKKMRKQALQALKQQAPATRVLEAPRTEVAQATGDELSRGTQALRANDVQTACSLLAVAVRSNPSNTEARRLLAGAFSRSGQYEAAASQYQALAQMHGLSADETLSYGRLLTKLGRYEPAIETLKNLVDSNPAYADARGALVKAYLLAGFNNHAREQCVEGMSKASNQRDYQLFKSLMP